MTRIPTAPLLLGLAGLIPFLWGAATMYVPALQDTGLTVLGPRFVGPYVQLSYGTIILSFMSGVLWGFATKADGAVAASGYAFVGLLALDWMFARQGLAPDWWMRLRILLTSIVVLTLIPVTL